MDLRGRVAGEDSLANFGEPYDRKHTHTHPEERLESQISSTSRLHGRYMCLLGNRWRRLSRCIFAKQMHRRSDVEPEACWSGGQSSSRGVSCVQHGKSSVKGGLNS